MAGGGENGRRRTDGGPRAIVFDLGNVVLDVDFARVLRAWSRASGVPLADIAPRFSVDEAYRRFERGEMAPAEYHRHICDTLGIGLSSTDFEQGWNAIFGGLVPGIEPVLRSLSGRITIACFTNTNEVHKRRWSELYAGTMALFDRVFVSSDMGCRKPDEAAFMRVATELGADPTELLFFDDHPDNVAGARRCGYDEVLVTSVQDVQTALRSRGLDGTGRWSRGDVGR
ncbi:MAG: HAD-IA family hydrolase [Planctomycetes bacterium]|nr:HAD-IA family hydrolase [Planctomycetota bacterium]